MLLLLLEVGSSPFVCAGDDRCFRNFLGMLVLILWVKTFRFFFLNNLWREIIGLIGWDVYFRGPDMMIELNYRFKDISGNFRNFIR